MQSILYYIKSIFSILDNEQRQETRQTQWKAITY